MTQIVRNEYPFFAGYVILQFIVLSVAWSILGGYAGYVNFGTSAFFGVGVYTAVFLVKATGAPLAVQIATAAAVGALLGLAVGPVDPAHARHLLFDRDHCAVDRDRDLGDQLALCRRRGRHPDPAAAGDGAVQQLCADAVFRAGPARGAGDCDRALHPALVDRPRPAGAAGRRACRRMHRRADLAAEASGLRHFRGADVRGRRARRDVPAIRRSVVRLQSQLFRHRAGDVADRRHRALDRPGARRHPARRDATIAGRHHLVGSQRAGARRDAGAVRGRRPRRHPRSGPQGWSGNRAGGEA